MTDEIEWTEGRIVDLIKTGWREQMVLKGGQMLLTNTDGRRAVYDFDTNSYGIYQATPPEVPIRGRNLEADM